MTHNDAKKVHDLVVHGQVIAAANESLRLIKQKPICTTQANAWVILRALLQHLLDNDEYLIAATLQWGGDVFNAEPESVQRVFKAWQGESKILLMGASSMGKTYSSGAWLVLDWLRDPLYTTVKVAAVNEGHLNDNLFAHIKRLTQLCAIPCKYEIHYLDSQLWFGVRSAGFEFGFSGIAFKQSQETSGQFKGYKSLPVRKIPHEKFGVMSRLRVLGDEGQNWPGGPFKDFNSVTASMDGVELIKIGVAFNPESTERHVVQMAEPEHGWSEDDLDVLYDYLSKQGWRVCRLDAAKSENVIAKKKVFEGLQTYEGYTSYLRAGGDNSANYWTFARGFPPLKGQISTIIPPSWPQEARGEAFFIENPIILGAADLAFQGKDSAQMAVGRWGLASGWVNHMGKKEFFIDRLNVKVRKPRHVLQIDQILPLTKHDNTVRMAEEIMGRCKMLKISPEWLACDKTSIGLGTYSHLNKTWGDCFGIAWNEGATPSKIIAEDKEGADKQCDGVMSEMWWAFRRWLDPRCCAILIHPMIPSSPINSQLTSRRYKTAKKGIKVESKDEYKARNAGVSPDEADSLVMLVHLVRRNSDVLPGLVEEQKPKIVGAGSGDKIKLYSIKSMKSIDEDDSLSPDGEEE